MSTTHSDIFRFNKLAVHLALAAIGVFVCCACIIGFRYEDKKLKAFIATSVLALIYQMFFADVVLMFLKGLFSAYKLRHPWSGGVNPMFVGGPDRKKYLQRRIIALKRQLELGPTFYKRNEAMTLRYKQVLDDLLLFGGYLLILLLLISETRDPLMFYHTRTIKHILKNPVFSEHVVDKVLTVGDLYNFINGTIIQGLTNGTSHDGEPYADGGWVKGQIAKVLGVIRLRQIRLKSVKKRKIYDPDVYGPRWSKELSSVPLRDKFWRIFFPWEFQSVHQTGDVSRTGKIYHHPGGGYVTLLGRNPLNSQRVLNFLRENDWIDKQTAVIIIEFTLYNVDADIFSLVKITAELTPFNTFVTSLSISAMKLLFNIDNLHWVATLAILLYFLVFMRVLAYVVLRMWFAPSAKHFLSEYWNYLDMTIVVLNFCILLGLWTRESFVKMLLHRVETSRKNEFISFSQAALIDEACTVMIAFLVALSTIRLWKILQFAKVFRTLTRTLYMARSSLSSTTFFIFVFIMGMALASFIINGSNSPKFMDIIMCISSLMLLSFGFKAEVSPSDLNHGGGTLGFIMYTVLVVSVTIFLVNMFITVLCLQFTIEKQEDSKTTEKEDSYTFWHFLKSEFSEHFQKGFLGYTRKKSEWDEAEVVADILRLRGGGARFGKSKENRSHVSDSVENLRRLQLISEILETQMDLLSEELGADEEEEDDEGSQVPEIIVESGREQEQLERPSTSKNSQHLLRKLKRNLREEEQLMTKSTEIRSP